MRIFIVLAVVAQLFLGVSAVAANKPLEIRQLDSSKNLAVIRARGANLSIGKTVIATSKEGTQCSMTVRSVASNSAVIDTSSCAFADKLRVGQVLKPSLLEHPEVTEAPRAHASRSAENASAGSSNMPFEQLAEVAPPSETLGITVFGFYDFIDKMSGDQYGNNIESQGVDVASETAFGVGVEYSQFAYHFPGFYANAAYEFGRDLNNFEQGNGKTISPTTKPDLSLILLGAGGNILVAENFYLKAGLNFNLPSVSGGYLNTVYGKLGYEGGFGLRFARNFDAELIYRMLKMNATGSAGGVDFNIENITASGVVLRGGYTF